MRQRMGDAMIPDKLSHFPLNRAYLCQDCNAVGNHPTHCPACASQALMGLAQVLDRVGGDGNSERAVVSRHPAGFRAAVNLARVLQ